MRNLKPPTSRRTSSTVAKAIDALFFLEQQTSPSVLGLVASSLSLPKPSTHRLLHSLMHRKLVEQDSDGRYRLGIGLTALGLAARSSDALTRLASPVMQVAAERLGETFFLVTAQAGQLVVVEKAEGPGFLRVAPQIGSRIPVNVTAVGAIFRQLAPGQLAPPYNRPDSESWPECAGELVLASHGQWQSGLSAVAAPVLVGRSLLAVLAVGFVTQRLEELGEERITSTLLKATRELNRSVRGPR